MRYYDTSHFTGEESRAQIKSFTEYFSYYTISKWPKQFKFRIHIFNNHIIMSLDKQNILMM